MAGADMEDVLLRCLQKKPEQRPSAQNLAVRLGSGDAAMPEGAVGSFFAELKRRRVYKVGAAYGAFMLVMIAFVGDALPALPFDVPEWTDSAILMITLAGLPVALILGWFYDITESGLKRTATAEGTPRGVKLLLGLGIALILVLTGVLAWFFVGR